MALDLSRKKLDILLRSAGCSFFNSTSNGVNIKKAANQIDFLALKIINDLTRNNAITDSVAKEIFGKKKAIR